MCSFKTDLRLFRLTSILKCNQHLKSWIIHTFYIMCVWIQTSTEFEGKLEVVRRLVLMSVIAIQIQVVKNLYPPLILLINMQAFK